MSEDQSGEVAQVVVAWLLSDEVGQGDGDWPGALAGWRDVHPENAGPLETR